MTFIQRVQSPTPKFFQKIRNGGLLMATIGAALLSAPATLPPLLLKIAGYFAAVGSVATAISQSTITGEEAATEPSNEDARGK